ncbi:MAG: ATP-dependent DNA helicase RecG [Anaeroplasmataceae bacterium]
MLDEDIAYIKGIGEKTKYYLNKDGIYKSYDLIMTLPKRYISYSLANIKDIKEDSLVTIKGEIVSLVAVRRIRGNLNSLIFTMMCDDTKIRVLIFGQEFLRYKLKKGIKAIFYGTYKPQLKEMVVRECFFDLFKEKIVPIYPISNISSKLIGKYIDNIYASSKPNFIDPLPTYLKEKYRLLEYNEYLYKAHFPKNNKDLIEITRRTKYETYLKYAIRMNSLRYYLDTSNKAPKEFDYSKIEELINSLAYKLTIDQENTIKDIISDLRRNKLMNRLVQGDVGSGKSIVALISAYATILSGYQVALMVPSEVLSVQHYNYFKKILDKYNIRIELLNSSIKKSSKTKIIEELKNGNIDIIIGTQSLIEDKITFKNLGLTIIDEQHKFGVNERSKLIEKGINVDSLFLTATPIPRTLGITRFGDLDISSIHSMPNGREKVMTKVVALDDDEFINGAIMKNVKRGHQVFVVVPVINESVEGNLININDKYEELKKALPNVRMDILHGDMKDDLKNQKMCLFKNHELDVLISTSVIEVGIDIENATLMIIYNAERFGLSSLHQLRGRVGRNNLKCGCILATTSTLCERLRVMEECYDCFSLSDYDLKLRGPGDILGNAQSGFLSLNIENDMKIYNCAKEDAFELYNNYLKGNKEKIVEDIINEINNNKIKLN